MSLTDLTIRGLKPKEKAYKIADQKGLYLLVNPSGSKLWRHKFRYLGKEKLLSYGEYPTVSLKAARDKHIESRHLLSEGIDPAKLRKQEKLAKTEAANNTFEAIAHEWFQKQSSKWTPRYGDKIMRRLIKDVFPWVDTNPISEISPPDLLSVVRRIEERGANESAHRVLQNCGQICRSFRESGA